MSLKEDITTNLVSIIIPAYNVEKYIDNAIISVLEQSYKNWELIIVNDASTDNTAKVVQQYLEKYPNQIKLIVNSKNRGCYVSRNIGIQNSSGEFLTILDGDDKYHKDKIKKQLEKLKSNSKFVGCLCKVTRNKSPLDNESSLMFKREVIEKIGYFDSVRYGADSEFLSRLKKIYGAGKIAVVNEVLYLALSSPNSLTKVYKKPNRNAYVKVYKHWHANNKNLLISFPLTKRPFPVAKDMIENING